MMIAGSGALCALVRYAKPRQHGYGLGARAQQLCTRQRAVSRTHPHDKHALAHDDAMLRA
jgi:hypothetical protein